MSSYSNMPGTWTVDTTEELLACYEEEDVLWKITHKGYHKKDVRQAALIRLSENLSIPVADIYKKITNLRTYFNKELSKEKKSKVSGSGTDQIYRSKWPFYDTMVSFLRDQVMPRKAISNLDADSDEYIDETQHEEHGDINFIDYDDSQTSTGTRLSHEATRTLGKRRATDRLLIKKKQLKSEDGLLRDASSALKVLAADNVSSTKTVKEDDDDDIYGKYIATEMRRIKDPQAKQYIKYKMQGLLFDAQYGDNKFGAGCDH